MAQNWRSRVTDAFYTGNRDLLEELLESTNRQSLDYHTPNWSSPLTEAVMRENKDMVYQLLRAGADVDFPDEYSRTPLMLAADRANKEICLLLLNNGANVNATTNCSRGGQTALNYALRKSYPIYVLLFEHGAK